MQPLFLCSVLGLKRKAAYVCMHGVMLIGSSLGVVVVVGWHHHVPLLNALQNPPKPRTYSRPLGIALEMESALNTSYCTLGNLGISAGHRGNAPTERMM